MFNLMDEISELVYVADLDNYDLLYINGAGREFFNVREYEGKKCYQVLQGLDAPCPFCTNSLLNKDDFYTWEYTNPVVKRHYMLKDKLINWEGKTARLELAFDITRHENERIALKNALDAEKMVMECVRRLYETDRPASAFPAVLERIGTFMSAERAYMFNINGDVMSNTYEWCAPHIQPQIDNLQSLDIALLGRWKTYFDRHECVIIEDLESIKDVSYDEYETLAQQDIHSLVAAPFELDGRLIGYLGVDNPPVDKLQNISPLLRTLCYFLMSTQQRVEAGRQLQKLSYYDTLTGFYNRNRYTQDIQKLSGCSAPFGITYLDVNGLKDINDQYGHAYGDRILKECAARITKTFSQSDFYRIGGDEFIIITSCEKEDKFHETVLELKKKFQLASDCQAAIGYQWVTNPREVQQKISAADAMMYEDKKRYYRKNTSSNRYRHHNDDILGLAIPGKLEQMLQSGHFLVFFQPKFSYDERSLIGVEALVRYRTNEDAILAPNQFLPLLEESRLISMVDFFVFDYSCGRMAKWLAEKRHPVPISVNFSRYSLSERGFIDRLIAVCQKHDLPKEWIEIEVTESVEDTDDFNVTTLIDRIREAGFQVSIDDFGVQYANLSLFTSVDFDVLKIDKSLIDNITTNKKAQSVVGALAEVCKKMNIRTIAEGVENEEQFAILEKMGFGGAQGYLFDKPLPVEEYEAKYLK